MCYIKRLKSKASMRLRVESIWYNSTFKLFKSSYTPDLQINYIHIKQGSSHFFVKGKMVKYL